MLFNFFKKRKLDKKYSELIAEANKLREDGDLDGAIKKYREAFEIKVLAFDYIALCFMEIDNRNYNVAIEMFEKVIGNQQLEGLIADCYFGLGAAYYGLENLDEAIQYLERAIEKGCNMTECFYIAANIYDELGLEFDSEETQKALQYYNRVLEKHPESLYTLVNIGTIYEHNNKNEEALVYFKKAYDLDKEKVTNACYNLGVTYTKLKQYEEAIQYYKEDLKQENPSRSTAYNLGLLYQTELHEYETAKQYYLAALEKDKEDYNTWYNLGCLYCNMKDYQNAYDCFQIIKYKKPEYIKGMETDNDLTEFIRTDYYQKILN